MGGTDPRTGTVVRLCALARGQVSSKNLEVDGSAIMKRYKSVKVYLDTSVYNRPFDDQTQPRIWLETLAFSVILQMIEAKRVILVSSAVLAYENSRNPFDVRRRWVADCSSLAHTVETVNTSVLHRAQMLEQQGVKAADALHVACA